jgi:hypothetical membrane protein
MQSIRYLMPVYILMIPVIFILPYFSAEGYSILKHTTSHLGAQNTPNAWIMNLVFCLLGLACILEAWFHLKRYWVHKILLTIFGAGLILTAFYQHAPIIEGIPYSLSEDAMHSLFATIVGFSFTLFAFSAAFIERTNKRRILAIMIGLAATGLSVLIFNVADLAGIWQRLMFIVSFAWLIFFLEGIKIRRQGQG